MQAPGTPPDAAAPPTVVDSRSWLTLAIAALGVLMVMADTTIVNVALPSIRKDLGYLEVSLTELQWVVNAYVLSFAVLLLAVGRLADLLGRRLLFVIGLVVFVAASIACGAAQDIGVLIGCRAVQGVGAALITPTSLSIVTLTFPEAKRGVAIAIWSGIVGVGVGLGPLAGGLLSEYVDWRWVFFINVPIGVIAVFGAFTWIRESRGAGDEQRLDVVGLVLSGVGFFLLTFALLQANEFGWSDVRTLLLFAGGFLALLAFVLAERVIRVPLLDLSLFRSRTFSGANATAIFVGFALFGLLFFGSIFTQNVMGYSAVESGASLLPMLVLIMILAPPVGKLTDRLGPRWLLSGGMGLLAIALLFFSRLVADSDFWDLLPGMLIGGVAFSLVLTPLTTAALAGVPIGNAGMGAAVINATRQIGGLLGLAVMGAISAAEIERSLREGNAGVEAFIDSFRTLMLIGAAVSLLGAVVAALTVARAGVAPPEAESAPDRLPVRTTNTWAIATPSVSAALPQVIPHGSPGVLIASGPESGALIPVTPEPFVFGRAEEALGRLGGDPELSRRHASVSVLDPGRLLVEDLSSTNGTFVNGQRIVAPTVVKPGDAVRLGATTLQIVAAPGGTNDGREET